MVRRGGIAGGCGDAQVRGDRWWGVRVVGGDGRGIREPDADGMAGFQEGQRSQRCQKGGLVLHSQASVRGMLRGGFRGGKKTIGTNNKRKQQFKPNKQRQ